MRVLMSSCVHYYIKKLAVLGLQRFRLFDILHLRGIMGLGVRLFVGIVNGNDWNGHSLIGTPRC